MNDRITCYIERLRAICAKPLSPRARLVLAREAAAELVTEPVPLGGEHRFVPDEGYARNLIHRDDEHGFVVVAMIWPPGAGGPPHDHGTWGVVAVSEGMVRVTNFDRDDDGWDPNYAFLTRRSAVEAGPGTVATVLPPHDDCHQVVNPTDKLAISIHTYGKNIEFCNTFNLESYSCEIMRPVWTTQQ